MYFTLEEQAHLETGSAFLGLGAKIEALVTAIQNLAVKLDNDATVTDVDYEDTFKAELGIE